MTNTTSVEEFYSIGARYQAEVTIEITSLESAGTEPWDPDDELAELDAVDSVVVASNDDKEHRITYDHGNQQFDVVETGSGDTTAGADGDDNADVGEVKLLVIGRR